MNENPSCLPWRYGAWWFLLHWGPLAAKRPPPPAPAPRPAPSREDPRPFPSAFRNLKATPPRGRTCDCTHHTSSQRQQAAHRRVSFFFVCVLCVCVCLCVCVRACVGSNTFIGASFWTSDSKKATWFSLYFYFTWHLGVCWVICGLLLLFRWSSDAEAAQIRIRVDRKGPLGPHPVDTPVILHVLNQLPNQT